MPFRKPSAYRKPPPGAKAPKKGGRTGGRKKAQR